MNLISINFVAEQYCEKQKSKSRTGHISCVIILLTVRCAFASNVAMDPSQFQILNCGIDGLQCVPNVLDALMFQIKSDEVKNLRIYIGVRMSIVMVITLKLVLDIGLSFSSSDLLY